MTIGVILVTYNASGIIVECLESLLASRGADLRIIVVDNASCDGTPQLVRDWAAGRHPLPPATAFRPFDAVPHGPVTLVEGPEDICRLGQEEVGLIAAAENHGFGGGVNLGLKVLVANPDVDFFWVLNPDCMVPPNTAQKLEDCARAAGPFAAIGGRVYYSDNPDLIQSDGGYVNHWTGICTPRNLGKLRSEVGNETGATLDFISGSHMLVSRDFIAQAGYMPEDYFLYYEEVEWCLRRGSLPLVFDADAEVYHHGGHSIGSATVVKGPSPLSAYFLNRARMKFVARHWPIALPLSWVYSAARATRSLLRGQHDAGKAALRAITGCPPTADMLRKIGRSRLP
jgi:GT2 family glycosyltransferase